MGAVLNFVDRLTNIMSGRGTTADARVWERYVFLPTDPAQVEAAYRSSWLVRKIVDVPPLDMTRAWRNWQAESTDIEKIEAEEKRLQLKLKCQRALILSRLYGGGALILGTKDGDPSQPLNADGAGLGGLTYAHVMSRHQLSIGEQILDPASPWFGKPEYFEINTLAANNRVRLHPSRVVEFIGQRTPEGSLYGGGAGAGSWFWGDPIMQSIGQAVRNADLAQDGFAALIERAAVDVFKFKDLMSQVGTQEGEDRIAKRVAWTSQSKSTHRAMLIDAEDEWAQIQITWAGIPQIVDSYLLVVAGAADIPMTRLLGQSPKGLQSTGDGEERDYRSMISARQDEQLAPALDRIDELLIPSAIGTKPTDVYYEFGPLQEENDKDAATIELQYAQALTQRVQTGILPESALAAIEKNRMIECGRYPGSETAFEDAEAAGDDPLDPANQQNEADLTTRAQQVAGMEQKGTITQKDAIRLVTDAAPRSLYVSRKLLNADAVIKWAKGQGFDTTVPAGDMHVTVLYSREPVDWMKMGVGWDQDSDGKLKVAPGGPRMLDRFGSMSDAVVLLFNSSSLSWRHQDMISNGASSDYADYAPHVTLSYDVPADFDLSKVEPYQGELIFGPEVFAEVKEDWKSDIEEE
jgi:phage-related protein (TIGR01555 family)